MVDASIVIKNIRLEEQNNLKNLPIHSNMITSLIVLTRTNQHKLL